MKLSLLVSAVAFINSNAFAIGPSVNGTNGDENSFYPVVIALILIAGGIADMSLIPQVPFPGTIRAGNRPHIPRSTNGFGLCVGGLLKPKTVCQHQRLLIALMFLFAISAH